MRQRIPYVTTALIAVNLIVFFLAEAVSGSTLRTDVLTLWGGAFVSLISGGQYWRLFTAMFLRDILVSETFLQARLKPAVSTANKSVKLIKNDTALFISVHRICSLSSRLCVLSPEN